MKLNNQVSNLINCLTNDEDKRQELWVYYLSGNEPSTFVHYLDKMSNQCSIDNQLQEYIWDMINDPASGRFQELLTNFSEVECSIVCLLALGLTINQVSVYKEITEIRIRQVVSVIKENDCWEKLYGPQKESNR